MNEEKPVRIGDREREEAVTRLGAHYEAGRLSAEEHQERVGEALQAKTQTELAGLFEDLPGERAAGAEQGSAQDEQWAGPWGWAWPPWTAPQDQAGARDQARGSAAGSGGRSQAQYGPPWMRGGRGPFGRVPLPLLMALGVVAVLASIACTVGGGHPPLLPLLLIVAGVVIVKKRRQGQGA
ncbi:DUF1707 SHOCT-like domain-containing protein [Kribbella catacumbae]|uniref:DUF1707 SHOCT-like domain-containing protein n=1 Tax=Kribbella catacumbae TaxID=460086 RepID=UPI000372F296|nr:DUF1707 domain-containing protein [Kribbella catacumbae]